MANKIILLAALAMSLVCASCSKTDADSRRSSSVTNGVSRTPDRIEGYWQLLDSDSNNEPESILLVFENNGLRHCRMVAIYHNGKIDDTLSKPVERAKGLKDNPPLCGLDFIWNLQREPNGRHKGKVVDPDSGSVYTCEVWVDESTGKLVIRGELLIFGKNEYCLPFEKKSLPFNFDDSKLEPNPPKF